MNAAGFDEFDNYFVIVLGAVGAIGAVGATGAIVGLAAAGLMVLAGVIAGVVEGNAAFGLANAVGAGAAMTGAGAVPIFACASGIKTLSIAIRLPLLAGMAFPKDFAFWTW